MGISNDDGVDNSRPNTLKGTNQFIINRSAAGNFYNALNCSMMDYRRYFFPTRVEV